MIARMSGDLLILSVASTRFEAARRLEDLPPGHRQHSLHGHGFVATAYGALPAQWPAFPGDEVAALRERLQLCLRPLDYALLNETIEQPSDEGIARWILRNLDAPGIVRVALRSEPSTGVEVGRDGSALGWRRYRFQAAHVLPKVPPGHKCGRMHGHGFEVLVHAAGVADRDRIDRLWAPLHDMLDYRCLNDIEGLHNPTSEMLSSWLWQRLKERLPELGSITVFETASCGASFDGSRYRIWKDFTLDSAVRLKRSPPGHPRGGLHGHTFLLRLHLAAPLDQVMGWTLDFGDVKALFDPLFLALDHRPLHESAAIEDADAASLARWVLREARRDLPQLARVDLYETEGCGAIVADGPGGPELPV
jgi:6-pyruvoyltetrahydropterin/6-carboxytetrahydropterin synthase